MRPRRLALVLVACAALQAAVVAARFPDPDGAPDTGVGTVPTTASASQVGGAAEITVRDVPLVPRAPDLARPDLPRPRGPDPSVAVVRTPSGVVAAVLGERDGQWVVRTPCGREATVPVAQPVTGVRIVLDPGHGGFEPGAVGPNGLEESDLNLAVAAHAAAALRLAGIPTLLTRDGDYAMTLGARAEIARGLAVDAIVSVHHNGGAVSASDGPGTEAYHQVDHEQSQRLAGIIWEDVRDSLGAYPIEWVGVSGTDVSWRTNAGGEDWYGMLRLPRPVTAVIAELAYLTGEAEAELLSDPEVQRAAGEALARAVSRFLTTNDPGSGFTPGGRMAPRPGSNPSFTECVDPPL